MIPIDAIFSPVQRVRFRTEDTRVGQRTNYDRLVLDIWSDGTVSPEMSAGGSCEDPSQAPQPLCAVR